LPQTNREYWERKIKRNVELAQLHNEQLQREGWAVVRIWEHEMADKVMVRARIRHALENKESPMARGAAGGVPPPPPRHTRGYETRFHRSNDLKNMQVEEVKQQSRQILSEWLDSCTRRGKIARNTVAVGIVVLDHLKRACPTSRDEVISQGGEVRGARSGLGTILESYNIPSSYLKEVTTRQGHQDGQRLFEQFEWGKKLAEIPEDERETLLLELVEDLRNLANVWLKRQNLKLDIDRRQAPTTWVNVIVENAKGRSGGVVEQHLVGAKLARRFKEMEIPNHPAHAGDRQTERAGDFAISQLVYHVTSAPSRDVLQKCVKNVRVGLHPVLLIPREQENKAQILAQDEGIDKELTIVSIEDFVALNIIELATEESKDFFGVLKEIVEIYNKRLSEVETDLSLRIEVR
jgi:hypothetical protein